MTDIRALITKKALAAGEDPVHALTVASIESRLDPKATNGHHHGLYAFGDQAWKTYGRGDMFDPEANIDAYLAYQKVQKEALKSALGREPTPQERYLTWQQGEGGGPKLLANPDATVASLGLGGNVAANRGDPNKPASAFISQTNDLYNKFNKQITGVDTLANITPSQTVATAPDWQMYQKPAPVPPAAPLDTPVGMKGLLTARTDPYADTSGLRQGMSLLAAGQGQQSWTPSQPSLLAPHRGEEVPLNYLRSRLGLLG